MTRCVPFGMSSLVPRCSDTESANAAVSDAVQHAASSDLGMTETGAGNAKAIPLERTLRASPALAASLGAAHPNVQLSTQPASAHEQTAPSAGVAAGAGGGSSGGTLPGALQGGTELQERLERCRGRAAWEEFLGKLQQDRSSVSQRWNERTRQVISV